MLVWLTNDELGKPKYTSDVIILLLTFPQTKNDFEKQEKEVQKEPKENVTPASDKAQVSIF